MALEMSVRSMGWARSATEKQTLPKTGADLARDPHLRQETEGPVLKKASPTGDAFSVMSRSVPGTPYFMIAIFSLRVPGGWRGRLRGR